MMSRFIKRRFATPIGDVPFIVDTIRKINDVELEINPSSAYEATFRSIVDRESKEKTSWYFGCIYSLGEQEGFESSSVIR
ncbi:hypothetical protein [Niabella hibiscisoli]|uniref:hypothetical protein n=1 Tax=Niabella hibiscisoli TaxID=1825928 RepID=UPI001F11681B|nr:hypothetical protein [Niabella hibiscisoli]MCH5721147.1 hypothetical protein [Niabella hibiscisoli]